MPSSRIKAHAVDDGVPQPVAAAVAIATHALVRLVQRQHLAAAAQRNGAELLHQHLEDAVGLERRQQRVGEVDDDQLARDREVGEVQAQMRQRLALDGLAHDRFEQAGSAVDAAARSVT